MSHIVALSGGVGGAKLAAGLAAVLPPEALTVIVNTGDDFTHLGLAISPDIDTVLYTLSGLSDRERGWGVRDESWNFMAALRQLGGEGWFQLGDRDLATHVERTRLLGAGQSLSEVTAHLARALGIGHAIVPMSDHPVRTMIATDEGELPFQHYFVARQCEPVVRAIRFAGAESAAPSPAAAAALARRDLRAIVFCPSNPWLSIDPILAVPGMIDAIRKADVPVVVVSPIVGGKAIKGPTAKIMGELGITPDIAAIARHYRGIATHLVIDHCDAELADHVRAEGIVPIAAATVMHDDATRAALAQGVLQALAGESAATCG